MAGHIGDMVSQHWNTPPYILEAVRNVIGGQIDLDPCDNEWSETKARVSYMLPAHNGLKDSWLVAPDGSQITSVFCNPPYGRALYDPSTHLIITPAEYKAMSKEDKKRIEKTSIADWIQRAYAYGGETQMKHVFLLIPSSTETGFWFDYIWDKYDAICFLKGRVAHPLEGKKVAASTKGSVVVYYGWDSRTFHTVFEDLGKVYVAERPGGVPLAQAV